MTPFLQLVAPRVGSRKAGGRPCLSPPFACPVSPILQQRPSGPGTDLGAKPALQRQCLAFLVIFFSLTHYSKGKSGGSDPPMAAPGMHCTRQKMEGASGMLEGWVGLDWIGLSCIELGWVGLHWVGLDCVGLGWVGLHWIALGCIGLGWVGLGQARLIQLDWFEWGPTKDNGCKLKQMGYRSRFMDI